MTGRADAAPINIDSARVMAPLGVRRATKAVAAVQDGDYSTFNVSPNGDLLVDGGQVYVFEQALTVTAGAYAADDVLHGEIEITNAARSSGGTGVIMQIIAAIEDDDADGFVADDIDIVFFRSNPAGTYTDNGALSVSDADAFEIEGVVTLNEKFDLGNITILQAANINIPYECNDTSLFAVPVVRGAKTPEATDAIQLRFKTDARLEASLMPYVSFTRRLVMSPPPAVVVDDGGPATGPGGVGSPIGLLLALTKAS